MRNVAVIPFPRLSIIIGIVPCPKAVIVAFPVLPRLATDAAEFYAEKYPLAWIGQRVFGRNPLIHRKILAWLNSVKASGLTAGNADCQTATSDGIKTVTPA